MSQKQFIKLYNKAPKHTILASQLYCNFSQYTEEKNLYITAFSEREIIKILKTCLTLTPPFCAGCLMLTTFSRLRSDCSILFEITRALS
jgi:hypothetical protein